MKLGKVCLYRPPYHTGKADPFMIYANRQKRKCFNAKTLHAARQCAAIRRVSRSSGSSAPGQLVNNRLHNGPLGSSVFRDDPSRVGGTLSKDDRDTAQRRDGGY